MEHRSQGLSLLHMNYFPGCHSELSNSTPLSFCSSAPFLLHLQHLSSLFPFAQSSSFVFILPPDYRKDSRYPFFSEQASSRLYRRSILDSRPPQPFLKPLQKSFEVFRAWYSTAAIMLNDIVKGPEGLNGEMQICCIATFLRDKQEWTLPVSWFKRCRMLSDWRLARALPDRRFACAVDFALFHR